VLRYAPVGYRQQQKSPPPTTEPALAAPDGPPPEAPIPAERIVAGRWSVNDGEERGWAEAGPFTACGDEAYRKKVFNLLDKISRSPSGQALLDRIAAFSYKCTIAMAGNFVRDEDGLFALDHYGAPLVGTGRGAMFTGITFDPKFGVPNPLVSEGSPDHLEPADAVLFHQLTHGLHMFQGMFDDTPSADDRDNYEEFSTIQKENKYLREIGYPYKRIDNHGGWAPVG
jgi:hypothetical protein